MKSSQDSQLSPADPNRLNPALVSGQGISPSSSNSSRPRAITIVSIVAKAAADFQCLLAAAVDSILSLPDEHMRIRRQVRPWQQRPARFRL
jgi:hypothetical protein